MVAKLLFLPPQCHVSFEKIVVPRLVACLEGAAILATMKTRAYLLWLSELGGNALSPTNYIWVSTSPPLTVEESTHKIYLESLGRVVWVTLLTLDTLPQVLNPSVLPGPPSCFSESKVLSSLIDVYKSLIYRWYYGSPAVLRNELCSHSARITASVRNLTFASSFLSFTRAIKNTWFILLANLSRTV